MLGNNNDEKETNKTSLTDEHLWRAERGLSKQTMQNDLDDY